MDTAPRFNNRRLIYISISILIFLLIGGGYFFYTRTLQHNLPIKDDGKIKKTPTINKDLFPIFKKNAYSVQKNADSTYDYYFYGKVSNVRKNGSTYTLTLTSSFGPSKGEIIEIDMPENIPPSEDVELIGENFQVMRQRGFKEIKIRIRYSKEEKPIAWELIR